MLLKIQQLPTQSFSLQWAPEANTLFNFCADHVGNTDHLSIQCQIEKQVWMASGCGWLDVSSSDAFWQSFRVDRTRASNLCIKGMMHYTFCLSVGFLVSIVNNEHCSIENIVIAARAMIKDRAMLRLLIPDILL